jgi:hypothetical protein
MKVETVEREMAERKAARSDLVREISGVLSKSPREGSGAAPWLLAELMVSALESYEMVEQCARSTAAWSFPGHQGASDELHNRWDQALCSHDEGVVSRERSKDPRALETLCAKCGRVLATQTVPN